MPPARRTPPPVDPTPLLVEVWTATAAAAATEPDPARRLALTAALDQQLTDARSRLLDPHRGPGTVPLEVYLRMPPKPSTLESESVDALPTALAALDETGPFVVSSPFGPVERRVVLEERLLRAVALGRELSDPLVPARPVLRLCVRLLARALAERAPGRSVELRVPPHVAVQCVEGPRHTRGTPPNVVEADALAFLDVATGHLDWATAVSSGRIRASGERADLQAWLPLLDSDRV